MNLVLIGYRGTGKSTVAKLLGAAARHGGRQPRPEIVRQAGRSIPEIVAEHGWPHFRDLEVGGDPARRGARRTHHRRRRRRHPAAGERRATCAATARSSGCAPRCRSSSPASRAARERPALTAGKSFTEEVEDVLRERTPLYESAADHAVDTDALTSEQVAARVVQFFSDHKPAKR